MKLYVKRKGKYIRAPEYWTVGYIMDEGYYLVGVHKGCTSYRRLAKKVKPDYARLLAALKTYEDAIVDALREATIPQPERMPKKLTKGQLETWEMIKKHFDSNILYHRSLADVAESAAKRLRQEIEREPAKAD